MSIEDNYYDDNYAKPIAQFKAGERINYAKMRNACTIEGTKMIRLDDIQDAINHCNEIISKSSTCKECVEDHRKLRDSLICLLLTVTYIKKLTQQHTYSDGPVYSEKDGWGLRVMRKRMNDNFQDYNAEEIMFESLHIYDIQKYLQGNELYDNSPSRCRNSKGFTDCMHCYEKANQVWESCEYSGKLR